ncbi:MAG: hypothetical protein JWN86_2627, partial [Planctomycetota bacterium]|nr:hypothetical protein [Planctomycetota bacterium]
RRITGAKKIALFGHRAVGKTTLLAMFYREASAGRVPGLRMAAIGPSTAEYLAAKIGQIEAGEPLAGTLAETELKLRLYHGPARFDLIVKDYQGEHVTLGTEAPIQEFFADCDAVFLCLDPETSDRPDERRKRQQEVDDLLERYIERSDDTTAGRPVALLVTKYDRVLDRGGPSPDQVETFIDQNYGMTRHALAGHAPHSAMFAVSSYGRGVGRDGRPPAELHPMGLEGPLGWLAEQLEVGDREQIEWLWDLAPEDLRRLGKCVKVYERRYPRSNHAITFRRKLAALRRKKRLKGFVRLAACAAILAGGLAAYDAWGFRGALAFEKAGHPPAAVEKTWSEFLAWHPTHPWIFPRDAETARAHLADWSLGAEQDRLVAGLDRPDLPGEIQARKIATPELAPRIAKVEEALHRQKHDKAWQGLQVADPVAIEKPEEFLSRLRAFLRDYPNTPHKDQAVSLVKDLQKRVETRIDLNDRQIVDALARKAGLPGASLRDLIDQAESFLTDRPESRYRGDVQEMAADFAKRLDEADIAKAREADRNTPSNFAVRRQRYKDYLQNHVTGGRFLGEATAAIDAIDRERDTYQYRQAYDHYLAHPDDVQAVAAKLRSYLDANPDGRHVKDAKTFIAWWEKVSVPNDYHVRLRRGEVEPDVGKYFSGGSPDLSVELWVAGVKHGPSPIVKDSRRPVWDHDFPRPIRWKLGDPISIRILDNDWSTSGVFTFNTAQGDKLAMKMLSGTVRPSKGGKTMLVFTSDFAIPELSKP